MPLRKRACVKYEFGRPFVQLRRLICAIAQIFRIQSDFRSLTMVTPGTRGEWKQRLRSRDVCIVYDRVKKKVHMLLEHGYF